MKAFGERLKHARETKGATLDAVARATRISKRYLTALERSDLAALPGRVFDKGYIKSYAEYLGVDAEPILEAYAFEERRLGRGTPEEAPRRPEQLSQLVDSRSPDGYRSFGVDPRHLLVAVSVVAALFVVAAWLLFSREPGPVDPSTESGPPTTLERSLTPAPEADPPVEPPDPVSEEEDEELPVKPARRLRITQAGVGTDVIDRNLVGRSDRFPEGSEVHFWTRVVGGEAGDRISHIWTHDGGTYVRADLPVGASHWRTHSSFVLPAGSAGEWVLEARDAGGNVLARETFVSVSPEGT